MSPARSSAPGRRLAPSLLLLVACLLPAPAPAAAPDDRPWLPTLAHHAAVEQGRASEASLARFRVPVAAARAYAVGHAVGRGYLGSDAHVCLAVPQREADGALLAWFVLVSDRPGCDDAKTLAERVRALRQAATAEVYGAELDDADVDGAASASVAFRRAVHARSKARYYSVFVSAYAFRTPVLLGHRGLPPFLVVPPPAAACGEPAPVPRSLRTIRSDLGDYAAAYDCGGEPLLHNPFRGEKLDAAALARVDLPATLATWKQRIAERGASPREVIERLVAAWTRHDGGAP